MNKLAYVIYSQKEANRKIWNYLMGKYELLKKKSIVLAYLWLPIACIVFGFVAVVSWISSLILFRKKVRFTPHYLRACIETANMSQEQTIAFLDDEFSVYKNKLSYGNIPLVKQKQIEATFDILYNQYKRPESDQKHVEIISNFSTLHQNLQTIGEETNRDLNDIKQQTDVISGYTERKLSEEKELEERKLEKAQKETSKYNREKGRNLDSFESALSDKQIGILVKYCNQIPIFNIDITLAEMKAILQCTHTKPLQTTVNKYIALLFARLSEERLICSTWMGVADRGKCFASKKSKLLNYKDLSTAYATSSTIEPKVENLIEECIDEILKIKD
ncbi:hypothetical protein IR148_11660 [Dysgonomonas mossii]|uniref:Uncharacterized protein n=1 Tax=Dysgonomonas mossii TaxID=163665 RepID=A0A4Y9ILA6_9BACT|nr:hypothetical protein [Dysgonomonas mossii]MBF0761701.1 hypothetical protein [Dysgonomonas mossii]TFU89337.1 hypothetical protein E4T88_11655 [Dysgonomonas mossii]